MAATITVFVAPCRPTMVHRRYPIKIWTHHKQNQADQTRFDGVAPCRPTMVHRRYPIKIWTQHKQNQADQTRFDGIDGSYMKRRGQAVSDPNACRYERLDVLDPTAAIDFASNRQAIVGRARHEGEKKHDPVAARSRSCPSCGNFAANRRSVAATCAATLSCDRHMTQNQHRWQRAVTTACAAGRKEKSHAKYTECAFL